MWGNWSRQPHAPGEAAGDKTYSLLSYASLLEASVNPVTALKPSWNLHAGDREGYGYTEIRLFEGGMDLIRRSPH